MIPVEIGRLARALACQRPDWHEKDMRLFLDANMTGYSWQDASIVCMAVATDPATQKIGRVLERGPWWQMTKLGTPAAQQPPPFTPERVIVATPEAIRAIREAIITAHPENRSNEREARA